MDAEGPEVPMTKRGYDRAQGMAKDGVVSQSALDDAEKEYKMALNKQNVAKAQIIVLQAKLRNRRRKLRRAAPISISLRSSSATPISPHRLMA